MKEQYGSTHKMPMAEGMSWQKEEKSSMSLRIAYVLVVGLMVAVTVVLLNFRHQVIVLQTKIARLESHIRQDMDDTVLEEENFMKSDTVNADWSKRDKRAVNDTQQTANIVKELDIGSNYTPDVVLQTTIVRSESRSQDTAKILQKELDLRLNQMDIALQTKIELLESHIQGTVNAVQKQLNNTQSMANAVREDLNVALKQMQDTLNIVKNEVNDASSRTQNAANKVQEVIKTIQFLEAVSWKSVENGEVPPNAYHLKQHSWQNPYYMCRSVYDSSLQLGLVNGYSCDILIGSNAHSSSEYEVLVRI